MFDSLDEQMKHDAQETSTKKERLIKYALIGLTSLLLFGGLYMGVRMLS
jgi:hypothetical protein